MSQSTYFNVTQLNAKFNNTTNMWEIDLPQWFTNSSDPNKAIELIGFYYIGSLLEDGVEDRIALHSPTLTDGRFQQLDHFITLSQYTSSAWSKRYEIKNKPQKFQFQFRSFRKHLIEDYNPLPESQIFMIEMNLFY